VGPRIVLDFIQEKNVLLLPGIEPWLHGRPVRSPVAIRAELSRRFLLYIVQQQIYGSKSHMIQNPTCITDKQNL
jgi:hypothetical protein